MQITTLGHSTHPWPDFQRLLEQHRIGCVADVRSYPRSRLPHFSVPAFRVLLNRIGISYVWLGDQLGGRPKSGPNRYDDMAQTVGFRTGIERLLEIAPRTRVAMLCSEGEVLDCHRFLLISRHLVSQGVQVDHIRSDGTVETHAESEERLMARTRVKPDLLTSHDDMLDAAYRRQEARLRGESIR